MTGRSTDARMVSAINYAFGLDYEAWTALAECVFADNSYRGGDS